MKFNFYLVIFTVLPHILLCQNQNEGLNKYVLRKTNNAQKLYFQLKKKDTTIVKKIITEEIVVKKVENKTKQNLEKQIITRIISEKQPIDKSSQDTFFKQEGSLVFSDVTHKDESPDKLFLNPYPFIPCKDSLKNNKCYIKIPANEFVALSRHFVQWRAITIPFVFRPRINDTIGSKVTTDLKIGASFSYNYNREKFHNRRIKAKRTVRGAAFGLGFGLSKVTLNSSNTSLSEDSITKDEDGLAFFITPGLGLNLRGFQIDFFVGWDIGITSNTKKWNYNKEHYLGIGLGVDISTFTRRVNQ